MSEPTDGSPSFNNPDVRLTALPPDAPWWARWIGAVIAANWDTWRKWVKRVSALIITFAPQLYAQIPALQDTIGVHWVHNLTTVLGVVVFIGTFEKSQSTKGDSP